MQAGEYIRDRLLPAAIRQACAQQNITLRTYSDDWVLQLSVQHKTVWIFGYKFDINAAAASHLAQDKVGTFSVLEAQMIAAVPHILVRSLPSEPIDIAKLQTQLVYGDVVIKPLNGTGGRGVKRYEAVQAAIEFIERSPESAWAISPYLDIVSETRFIVLADQILLAYAKQRPEIIDGLKFYNLSHGAVAVDIADRDISTKQHTLAVQTCQALGLRLAAVDIVQLAGGEELVLEVNDGFSMEYYARQSAANKARALALYDTIVARMFR